MEAFIEQRKRASPKRTDLLAGKASGPMASLKPNETQRPKELPATRRQVALSKSPFVRTSYQPKQAWQSSDLQHSTAAKRNS